MDFGIVMFSGYPISPARLGRAVEERGFDALFYPEHTHIPVHSRRTDGSSTAGFAHTYDPFVALGAVAAVTERIKLGTGVCLVPERDPIVTAKAVATLDHMSGGRVMFGVGAGWNREELVNHGTDPRTRMAVLADRVRAIRTIWAQDEAEYHGEYVDFDPIWSWPKPARRPGPPVLVGGNGPGTEDRVLEFGDEWLPQCGPLASVEELRTRIANLRDRAGTAVPVTLFGAVPTMLDEFAAAGVNRCLFSVRGETEAELLSTLDDLAGHR
ncbi:MAG TPA: LLM class F420-dependent oxidoreductase [Pseudonocardiaceae bacterium]|jgi:probable F420-dependent oxidoreductase